MIVKLMNIIRKTIIKIKIMITEKGTDVTRFLPSAKMCKDRSCLLQRRSLWQNPSMNLISLTVSAALLVIDFFLTL